MGTLYSAITSEMRSADENMYLALLGGGYPTIQDDWATGGTYSRELLGPENPLSMPTPASNEFTCGQWVKTEGPDSDGGIFSAQAREGATANYGTVAQLIWKHGDSVLELWTDDAGPSWVAPANFVLRASVNMNDTKFQRTMNWQHMSFYVDWQIRFVFSAYLDGIQILTYTAGTNWEWLTPPAAVTMWEIRSTGTAKTYLDGSYVEDVDAEGDQIPEGYKFIMVLPDGAGSSSQWTPDAGTNYARVNEATAPDDDTTYVETATGAQLDLYTFGNIVAGTTPGYPFWGPSEFTAVLMQSFYRIVNDGEATEASYDHVVFDGASSSTDGPFTDADDFDWHFAESIFLLQPDGTAWNLADFNAWTHGIETN